LFTITLLQKVQKTHTISLNGEPRCLIVVHCCLNTFEEVIRFRFIVLQTNTNCLPVIAARLESRQAEEMHVTAEQGTLFYFF